jgi:hypothetical protein
MLTDNNDKKTIELSPQVGLLLSQFEGKEVPGRLFAGQSKCAKLHEKPPMRGDTKMMGEEGMDRWACAISRAPGAIWV